MSNFFALALAIALTACVFASSNAEAACRQATETFDGDIVLLRCGELVIAAEAGAVRSSLERLSSHPDRIQLDAGTVAISAPPLAEAFAVLTPDAVVYARDAVWLVNAASGHSIVTVLRGAAIVQSRSDGSNRTIEAGGEPDGGEDGPDVRLIRALERAGGLR